MQEQELSLTLNTMEDPSEREPFLGDDEEITSQTHVISIRSPNTKAAKRIIFENRHMLHGILQFLPPEDQHKFLLFSKPIMNVITSRGFKTLLELQGKYMNHLNRYYYTEPGTHKKISKRLSMLACVAMTGIIFIGIYQMMCAYSAMVESSNAEEFYISNVNSIANATCQEIMGDPPCSEQAMNSSALNGDFVDSCVKACNAISDSKQVGLNSKKDTMYWFIIAVFVLLAYLFRSRLYPKLYFKDLPNELQEKVRFILERAQGQVSTSDLLDSNPEISALLKNIRRNIEVFSRKVEYGSAESPNNFATQDEKLTEPPYGSGQLVSQGGMFHRHARLPEDTGSESLTLSTSMVV